jgi:predicted signal transduction protein with EAL and GGDEF domain
MVDASVGAALYPKNGQSAEDLLRSADVAMYSAKASGGGCVFYESNIDSYDSKRMALLSELKTAIAQDSLELHFQPKVRADTHEVDSVEALIRWRHPIRGDIPPGDFVPLAEWTGLMMPLTKWVLRAALRQAKCWQDRGSPLPVAVNLSASTLHNPMLVSEITELLIQSDIPSRLLVLEITETAVMNDPVRAKTVLQKLAALGVGLSIDDFGTGYSSIASLKTYACVRGQNRPLFRSEHVH